MIINEHTQKIRNELNDDHKKIHGDLERPLNLGQKLNQFIHYFHKIIPLPQEIGEVGLAAGILKLQESFAQIPLNARIRLAKKTSNLFRSRVKNDAPGLDVSGLNKVIWIDPQLKVAKVGGMCTYEDLVATTLAYGLAPYVVPQLKTITLGGAITGLGVESSSFRLGLPHESVLSIDILLSDGSIITATPTNNYSDLYYGFPNSYGSLGYCVSVEIALESVLSYVELRHIRYTDIQSLSQDMTQICQTGEYDQEKVDYIDGVGFSSTELYITVARKVGISPYTSDYTGEKIYYRSIQHDHGIKVDYLTIEDYFWRWDTDWFWCSRAFGAQKPQIRKWWPRRWLRSSFYWKIVALDRRFDLGNKLNQLKHQPELERVVQDVEFPMETFPEFVEWFFGNIPISPIWFCPLATKATHSEIPWPLYPLKAKQLYINIGFWSAVPAHTADKSYTNRIIEKRVSLLHGHKSLYSEVFYEEDEFWSIYGGETYWELKSCYDAQGRFSDLYTKVVRNQ